MMYSYSGCTQVNTSQVVVRISTSTICLSIELVFFFLWSGFVRLADRHYKSPKTRNIFFDNRHQRKARGARFFYLKEDWHKPASSRASSNTSRRNSYSKNGRKLHVSLSTNNILKEWRGYEPSTSCKIGAYVVKLRNNELARPYHPSRTTSH